MIKNKLTHICSGILIATALFFHLNSFSQNPTTGFFASKGKLQSHLFTDKEDSLSSREIIELDNEKGLPIWFGRDIIQVVCLTKECRMVHLWLFWDGAGNYFGFQEYPDDPLTKTDHMVFSAVDYQKLNHILADSVSILKNLKQEELIIKPDINEGKVDAISGATQPSLKEYLVSNAAYTCYTLWHSVYGNTRIEIQRLLEQRADSNYLKLIFNQDNTLYLKWAIEFIKRHPDYHSAFFRQIVNQMKSKDENLSQLALNYFDKERLSSPDIQKELMQVFDEISYPRKFEFFWKLSTISQIDDEVILKLLQLFDEQRINASLLGYVYKLIHADNLKTPQIIQKLKTFSKNENLYVRIITDRLLKNQIILYK